jgi:hypothetical protein
VPLLFFWALALFAYLKLLAPDWRWALFGISLGLGSWRNTAMIYFALGVVCAAWPTAMRATCDAAADWVLRASRSSSFRPTLYWNVAKLRHAETPARTHGTGLGFARRCAGFVGSQFAVAGPLVFVAFLVVLVQAFGGKLSRQDKLMLAFAVPPLALVSMLSFFRDANANWAAPSALAMTVLVVAWWLRKRLSRMAHRIAGHRDRRASHSACGRR